MRRTLLAFAVLAGLGIAAFLLTRPSPARLTPPSREAAVGDSAGGTIARAASVAEASQVDAPAAPDAAIERSDVATRAESAVIRGRCVDENGQPLSGVPVHLHGAGGNSERMARHELDHGKVEWSDPEPVLTDADGRFEHRFDPPPPYQFLCEPRAEGRVGVYGRWGEIAAATEIAMGDIVLEPGVEVSGRVVDESGQPVAKRYLTIEPADGSSSWRRVGELTRRDGLQAHTDARGMFRGHWPLPVGEYAVEVQDAEVKSPAEPIRIELPTADLHVVVAHEEPRPSIEGVVVDERGQPIASATVGDPLDPFGGTTTGRDGRFVLRQAEGKRTAALELRFAADGRAEWRTPEPVEWGTRDLRVMLQSGPPLTVAVRRADDGTPVVRFGIRLAPVRERGGWSSIDDDLKHLGDHPDGLLKIDHATTGRYRLTVVPGEGSGLPESPEQEIEIEVGVPRHVDVRLEALAQRTVVVTDTSGRPVAGARVELLFNRGSRELTLESTAMQLSDARMNSPEHVALLVDEGATDADGRVTLRGRTKDVFALRLPGPGAVPTMVAPFSLDEPEDAHVTVAVGGILRGRLEPPAVVVDLREDAGLPAEGEVTEARLKHRLPTVYLRSAGGAARGMFPSRGGQDGVPLGRDGTFELAGVPPGEWDLVVHWWQMRPSSSGGFHGGTTHRIAKHGITIAEGATVDLAVDLARWVRHPITIRARLDRQRFTGGLTLSGQLPTPGGDPAWDQRIVPLTAEDTEDTVQVELAEGTWTVGGFAQLGDERVPLLGPTFAVAATGPRHIDVEFTVVSRTLRILDHEGEPVVGVVLNAHVPDTGVRLEPKPTDEAGCTTLRGPAVQVQLRTRRKPLMDDASLQAWMREHPAGDDRARAIVNLGTVDLVPGASAPHTIRLPKEWAELPK